MVSNFCGLFRMSELYNKTFDWFPHALCIKMGFTIYMDNFKKNGIQQCNTVEIKS